MADSEEVELSLFEAIRDNDLKRVEEIVNLHGLAYCESWAEGFALLCSATEHGHDEIAKFLLQKDAKISVENCTEDSPLHYAIQKGSAELVKMLLSRNVGSPQNRLENLRFFYTLFRIAAQRGNADIVRLIFNGDAKSSSHCETLCVELDDIACRVGFTEFQNACCCWRNQSECNPIALYLALILASSQGDEEIVSSLLSAGVVPNAVNESGIIGQHSHSEDYSYLPFLLACAKGHLGVVKLLIAHGAQLNCSRQGDHYTAIHLAAERGGAEIVDLLLGLGFDPNSEANDLGSFIAEAIYDITPLHSLAKSNASRQIEPLYLMTKACSSKPSEVVELLLSKGADINAETSDGSTPLLFAVKNENEEVAKILLERGANVNETDLYNVSPLQQAVDRKNSSLVNLLLRYNPDIDNEIKMSVLRIAVDPVGYVSLVDYFFYYDHVFNREHLNDPRLLSAAVEKGYLKMVKTILSYGLYCKDEIRDPTLLHVAVKNGHPEVVDLLLKSGYDVNGTDENGSTPISYTMSCQKREKWIEVFRILLASGAVLENVSKFLHSAINKDCLEICKLLVEDFGADVNGLDTQWVPLLLVLFQIGNLECGKKIETIRAEIAELLLRNGADVHAETEYGITGLEISTRRNNAEAVRVVLMFGADVNARVKKSKDFIPISDGPTPLHSAAEKGYADVVRVLLEFDANIDARTDGNRTALHRSVFGNHDEVVKILLDNGCDINVEHEETTALDLALLVAKSIDYIPFLRGGPLNNQRICDMLKMYAIKLRVAGLYISEKIQQNVNPDPDFQEACEKELSRIKNEKLCCHLTLHDILLDLRNPAYLKNESLKQTLGSVNFDDYPIYGSLIANSFERNRRKIELLAAGEKSLNVLVKTRSVLDGKESPILLDEVKEKILSYLRDFEMKNLISAGEAIKNQVCK